MAIVHIRVMAQPSVIARTVALITEGEGLEVDTVRGPYANRDGAQVRVYITAELKPVEGGKPDA